MLSPFTKMVYDIAYKSGNSSIKTPKHMKISILLSLVRRKQSLTLSSQSDVSDERRVAPFYIWMNGKNS